MAGSGDRDDRGEKRGKGKEDGGEGNGAGGGLKYCNPWKENINKYLPKEVSSSQGSHAQAQKESQRVNPCKGLNGQGERFKPGMPKTTRRGKKKEASSSQPSVLTVTCVLQSLGGRQAYQAHFTQVTQTSNSWFQGKTCGDGASSKGTAPRCGCISDLVHLTIWGTSHSQVSPSPMRRHTQGACHRAKL